MKPETQELVPTPSELKCCERCKTKLPLSSFGKNRSKPDGLQHWCRDCRKIYFSANRPRWRSRALLGQQKWRSRNREKTVSYSCKYAAQDPKKIICRRKTRQAIKSGVLKKQPCQQCGSENAQAHHDDYDKPLEVKWLCALHHSEYHKQLRSNK